MDAGIALWVALAVAAIFLLLGLVGMFAWIFLEPKTVMGHKND